MSRSRCVAAPPGRRRGWSIVAGVLAIAAASPSASIAADPAAVEPADPAAESAPAGGPAEPGPASELTEIVDLTGAEGFDDDLAALDLEDLLGVEVTSVAGAARSRFRTAAAVTVLERDDIRRSGHLFLAEALRDAPGVQVGRISASQWAIGVRGLGSLFSGRLLVRVDGREVYDPSFAGVFWETQDFPLHDLDRIEVVRGPGATLWGENAVNGVINVESLDAFATQGTRIGAGGGTPVTGLLDVRHGVAWGDRTALRVYGRGYEHDELTRVGGGGAGDDFASLRLGARLDHDFDDDTRLTVISEAWEQPRVGRVYRRAQPAHLSFVTEPGDDELRGAFGILRLATGPDADRWKVQGLLERFELTRYTVDPYVRETAELDVRNIRRLADRMELAWGGHVRTDHVRVRAPAEVAVSDDDRRLLRAGGFAQLEWTLDPDRLVVMAGTKVSYNDYTGVEVQPSARVSWTPDDRHALWAAVSRAVATPSILTDDVTFTFAYVDPGLAAGGPPAGSVVPLQIVGNPELDAETLIAYEAGWRHRPTDDLLLDLALFVNDYDELVLPNGTTGGIYGNTHRALTWGGEFEAIWTLVESWRLRGWVSGVHVDVDGPFVAGEEDDGAPALQAGLRSSWDLGPDLELDASLSWSDEIAAYGIDDRLRLDVGLTWRVADGLSLTVTGQNLLAPDEPEYETTFFNAAPAEVERGVFAGLVWEF